MRKSLVVHKDAILKQLKMWYTNKQNRRETVPVLTNACVAQLVEQRIRNAQVIGSSPITSSKISVRIF